MTDDHIRKLVTPLLRKMLAKSGYRSATVEVRDRFRWQSDSLASSPASCRRISRRSTILDAQHEIRSLLMMKGDDRFVFLDAVHPHEEFADEDIG